MTRVTQLIHDAGKYLLISVYPLPTHPTHNFTHTNGGNLETLPGWPKKLQHNRPARSAGQWHHLRVEHIDGLVQDWSISIVNALEIIQSCTKPPISHFQLGYIIWSSITSEYHWHDDVIKWKHFPRYWPFVRRIHRWPVNSPHKSQWRGALMFFLICTRINGWVNNGEASYLRRYRAHFDVTVMNLIPLTVKVN